MNEKKRVYLLVQFLFLVIILTNVSNALGVSPAKIELNFEPGFEESFLYKVYAISSDQKTKLYAEGDFSEYVELDKDELIGEGTFIVKLKLPSYIEKPGKHRIWIVVREEVGDEEVAGSVIATSITIRAAIDVYVPYPGRYIELALNSNDVNAGEPVEFELDVMSKGSEDVDISPKIEIMSSEKTIETLYFKDRTIKSQEEIKLKKTLDTATYNPGKYTAIAIVDYGKIAKAESEFRIGELIINLVNYTKEIVLGGIRGFDIGIESGWNNKIESVHAEVSFLKDSQTLVSFKTSPTELTPWETKTITGFFDASNFSKGTYDTNITFFYYGKDIGKSSSEFVKVKFVEETNKMFVILIIAGIVFLIIIGFLVKKYLFKNTKKGKKR